ncbi:MAG TPA: glycosyl hydrolase [Planctomycetes bacterium]|nr:glycosyl hydrolase [Planctomycetota bacterium]
MRLMTRFLVLALLLSGTQEGSGQRPAPHGAFDTSERQAAWERHRELQAAQPFKGLVWRSVGPVIQGGRVVDVAFVPGQPGRFYAAYATGGLWRTDDNGQSFRPLFDHEATTVLGAVATDPSHPDRVWVGTGESNSSRSSYGGMGVYRSDDAGRTWTAVGLADTDRIGRIVVDPENGDRVFVAGLGKLYTQGGRRGVFRTTDGGRTWEHVLQTTGMTGAIDLVIDPTNSKVVYAATWERSRRPWDFIEGGNGSGIWKSTDGGTTWKRLEGGLPRGENVGRIGLALCASRPRTLYCCIDNQAPLPEDEIDLGGNPLSVRRVRAMTTEEFLEFGVDRIEGFLRGNDFHPDLDAETLIEKLKKQEITLKDVLDDIQDGNAALFDTTIRGLEVWRSDDAGEHWTRTHEKPLDGVVNTYGYYFGQIRVAPSDPETVITVGVPMIKSTDGGKTWSSIQGDGMHVDHHAIWIDPHDPRHILGGNDGGLDVTFDGGEHWDSLDAQAVGQFYTVELDDAKPYNIYGGLQDNGILKGSSRSDPQRGPRWTRVGGGDGMYVRIDVRDGKTIYFGSQFGHYRRRGPDGGHEIRPRDRLKESALRYNWATPILLSPHTPEIVYFGANKLFRSMDRGESWAAISPDLSRSPHRGDVPFATLTAVDESTLQVGRLWAGTDDGQIWTSKDAGLTWDDVGAGLPRDRWVSRLVASRYAKGRCYVTLNGYRDDDGTPYVYVTEDNGRTWRSLAQGLPGEAVNVIREDPLEEDILYVGTDRGVYVSLDRGESWMGLGMGLPSVPVHDLKVHRRERELVAATHGRSVWILDILPVQDSKDVADATVHVYPVEDRTFSRGWRRRPSRWRSSRSRDPEMKITYWAKEAGDAVFELQDRDGRVYRRIPLVAKRGVNVFTWDLKVDEKPALAAEQERLEKNPPKTREGIREKMPVQEALRLGWPLYAQPGSYRIVVRIGDAQASTDFKMKAPSSRRSSKKKKEKIRGKR